MGVLRGFEQRLEGAVEGMFARMFKSGLQPIELAKAVQRYCGDHKQVTAHGVVTPNDYRLVLHPDDLERMASHGDSLPRELGEVVRATCDDNDWELAGTPRFTLEGDDDILVGRFEVIGRIRPDRGRQQPAASSRRAAGGSPDRHDASRRPPGQSPPPSGPAAPAATPATPAPPGGPGDPADSLFGSARTGDGQASSPAPASEEAAPAHQVQPPSHDEPADDVGGTSRDTPPTQAMPPASDPASPPRPAGRKATALQVEILDTGDAYTLPHGRHTIGRDDSCDITIDSTTVSRKHAVLLVRGTTWWIYDLGSTNGTRVNGKRASELPIGPGDRVRVGTIDVLVKED